MKRGKLDTHVLVRGSNDVASATAHCLFQAGYRVVLHDSPSPTVTRRKMAFADAIFDGEVTLEGVMAKRVESIDLRGLLLSPTFIPVVVDDFERLVQQLGPQVLVDARMQKHKKPDHQFHLAALVIGLGPNFVAGDNVHMAIETARGEDLGKVIDHGSTKKLEGEPISMGGYARERYVYAPLAGRFITSSQIGESVIAGQEIASIDSMSLHAPISGIIRGLTHADVYVELRSKVIEIDPRGEHAQVTGIGERPARIAQGVLTTIQNWEGNHVH